MRRAYATKEAIMNVYAKRLLDYILWVYTPEEFMNFVKPVLNGTIELQVEESESRREEVYHLTIPDEGEDIMVFSQMVGEQNFRELKDK